MRFLGTLGHHRQYGGQNYAKLEKAIRMAVHRYDTRQISAEVAEAEVKKLSDQMIKQILACRLISASENDEIVLNTDGSKYSWGASCFVKRKGILSYHGGTFAEHMWEGYSTFAKEIIGLLHGLEENLEFIVNAPKVTVNVDNLAASLSSTTSNHHTKPIDIVNILRIQQLITMCKGKVVIKHVFDRRGRTGKTTGPDRTGQRKCPTAQRILE